MRTIITCTAIVFAALPAFAYAQELYDDTQGIWRAQVVEAAVLPPRMVPGTDIKTDAQYLTAKLLDGPHAGEVVEFENDYVTLARGDRFYLNYLVDIGGEARYSVREPDRLNVLLLLGVLFAAAVVVFGGTPGLRSLAALAASVALILFGLLPLLLAGYPPLLTSIAFAVGIVGLSMALTHGLSRPTAAAFFGSMCAVVAAGTLGSIAVSAARLSGFASDEAVFLNISTYGSLDIQGLLLSAIIIGALGVLDDIAITQAAAVEELNNARGGEASGRELYVRASRIGQAHIGAVVNTLALAYVGASLPLLLLFSLSEASWPLLINQEVVAVEIVRTMVGSMALALAVPATTLASVFLVRRFPHWQPQGNGHHTHTH